MKRDPRFPRSIAFDTAGFESDLRAIAETRGQTMYQVACETGVSAATLTRMKQGKKAADAAGLAALCKWSGLDIAKYSVEVESA